MRLTKKLKEELRKAHVTTESRYVGDCGVKGIVFQTRRIIVLDDYLSDGKTWVPAKDWRLLAKAIK